MPIKLSKVKSQSKYHCGKQHLFSSIENKKVSPRNDFLSFRRITNISNGNFKTLKPLLASGVILLLAIFSVTLNALPTYAAITLSVSSSDETFNLLPGKFNASNPVNISVSTDDDGGYNLSISGPENNILLKTGTTNVGLNSISDDKLSTNFGNNEFGIKYCKSTDDACINGKTYVAAPGNDLLQIDKTTESNSTPATYALSVGAKVDASAKDSDEYSGNFVIFASANATSYSINYVDPQDSWPASTTGSTTGTKINLSSVTPTKSGYTFNGWCSVYTDDGTCSGTTYQPGEEYELSNGAITNLYAMWGRLYMQDVGTWGSTVTTGSTVIAVDSRDGTEYTVGRLADNKLWLLDNLAFTGQDASGKYVTWDSTTTNITGTLTWSSSVIGITNDYTNPKINVSIKDDVIGTATLTGESTWKYGVLYNFAAASAGSITGGSNSSATSQDICPKGWRLPTGGSSGEYVALDKALGGTGANRTDQTATNNMRNALHLPLSGNFNNGSLNYQGSYGYFWSSTAYTSYAANRYYLSVDASSLNPQSFNDRQSGYSVRCVAP